MHTFGSYTIGMVRRDVFYRLERGYLNPKVDKVELAPFSNGYP
jgi:hypothetical protein